MEKTCVGIQLGNSLAKISILKANTTSPEVAANEDGDRILPVNIAVDSQSLEMSYFLPPLAASSASISIIFDNFFDPFCNSLDIHQQQVFTDPASGTTFSTKELCSLYLRRLLQVAMNFLGSSKLDHVAISLSSSLWNNGVGGQRLQDLIKNDFSSMIDNVSAYSQSYCSLFWYMSQNFPKKDASAISEGSCSVLEMGGSGSYLSKYYFSVSNPSSIAPVCSTRSSAKLENCFSGKAVDEILFEFVRSAAEKKFKTNEFSKKVTRKLRSHCEQVKRTLSQSSTAHIFIESLYDGMDFSLSMQRGRFESLLEPSISSLIQKLKEMDLMQDLNAGPLLVVGSCCKKPILIQMLKNAFANAVVSAEPDEIGVKGASLLARYVSQTIILQQRIPFISKSIFLLERSTGNRVYLVREGSQCHDDAKRIENSFECGEYEIVEFPLNSLGSFHASESFKVDITIQQEDNQIVMKCFGNEGQLLMEMVF